MSMSSNLKQYMDVNQLNLYKKFASTHFLSKLTNVINTIAWCTFFRRNLHRFAIDYLKLNLHLYQQIALQQMGQANSICIIASRNAAKSFLIALYACCRAILYPGSKIVIGSATRGQSKLIVTEKIQNELMVWSEPLRREIKDVVSNSQESIVKFHNNSTIKIFTANDNARGLRSNVAIREEFRQIPKHIDDQVISPFQTPRNPLYLTNNSFYQNIKELEERPVDIYISSSWQDATHWMWDIVDSYYKGMLNHNGAILLAFDESVALKHKLKLKDQLIAERRKQDPTTWKVEFLNLRVKDSQGSYFTYSMLMNNQVLTQVFYPSSDEEFKYRKNRKLKYAEKQDGEVRVISCDIAFVAGEENDNSIYSCIRGIPEITKYDRGNDVSIEIERGYKRKYPYIESNQIGDTTKQAIRIRQLYEDFDADYIVIDARNGGVQIIYELQKVQYDEEREVEYKPLKCMNNDTYAMVCQDNNAPECIYAITGSQSLNSTIATQFRRNLVEHKIEFLVNYNTAKETILNKNKNYTTALDEDEIIRYESPFLETMEMVSECAELQYEKLPSGIRIHEKGRNRKDRYSSVSYGSYFLDELENDLGATQSDYEYQTLIN